MDQCPCCKQSVTIDREALGDSLLTLTDSARDVFDAIYFSAPRSVSANEIFNYVYDDIDGGPSDAGMRQALNTALLELDQKLVSSPVRVVRTTRPRGWRIQLLPGKR